MVLSMFGVTQERLTRLPVRRPLATFAAAALALALAGASIAALRFQVDVAEVVETPAARVLSRTARLFGLNERAYLLVESPTPDEERLVRCGEALAQRLGESELVDRVELGPPGAGDEVLTRLLRAAGPLWFEPARLEELRGLLDPAGLEAQLLKQAERLSLLGLGEVEGWVEADPLELHRPFVRRLASLRGAQRFAEDSPLALSADRRALLVTVVTSRGTSDLAYARRVTETLERARREVLALPWAGELRVRATGGHLFAEESERIIREDITRGLGLCLVLALLLLAYGLRLAPWRTALLLAPTSWGLVVGLGLFGLLREELTVLSLGCASVLVGLGVDFTIHLCSAARAAAARGRSPRDAAHEALVRTRGALVLAALTSIAAFLAFQLAHQRFLADMGLLTACGLAACLLGALTLVPALLGWTLPAGGSPAPARSFGVERLVRGARRFPRAVLALTCLLSLGAAALVLRDPPSFSGDLRQLHARDSRPLAAQDAIGEVFGGGLDPLVLLVEAEDEAAAVAAVHRLDPTLRAWVDEGRLSARASAAGLLPPRADQEQVLALLAEVDPAQARADLRAALEAIGFDPAAFAPVLAGWERALARRAPADLGTLRAAGLGALAERFVYAGPEGAVGLILLTPPTGLWEERARGSLAADVAALLAREGVRGELSGLPFVSAEATRQIGADFEQVSLLTALAVAAVLVLRFRALGLATLALLPAALGTLWTAGAFVLLGAQLNLMNLGVLPMVLALGVDDGIHVVHGHLGGEAPRDHAIEVGVLLTSLTTLVAFGSLALSRNRGIASVGLLTLLGVTGCLLASVVVLPALLELRRPARAAPSP